MNNIIMMMMIIILKYGTIPKDRKEWSCIENRYLYFSFNMIKKNRNINRNNKEKIVKTNRKMGNVMKILIYSFWKKDKQRILFNELLWLHQKFNEKPECTSEKKRRKFEKDL